MKIASFFASVVFGVTFSVCTASAGKVIDLKVACNGDSKPTGFIATMVDYAGVQALWKLCDAQGGKGTVEAQITHDMDLRVGESAGSTVNRETILIRGVQLPAKMVGGKIKMTKIFSGMADGKYLYRWTDKDKVNRLGMNAVMKRCDATSDTKNPHVCTEWFEFGRQSFVTETKAVKTCPTLHSYSLSVAGTVVGGTTLGGGACRWKSL